MLRKLCMIFLLLLMLFGPHGLMQMVAWTGMGVSYSLQDGLRDGIRDTFSGERPCDLCVVIFADSQQQEDGATAPRRVLLVTYVDAMPLSAERAQPQAQSPLWRLQAPRHLGPNPPGQVQPIDHIPIA